MDFRSFKEKFSDRPIISSKDVLALVDNPQVLRNQLNRWSKAGLLLRLKKGFYLFNKNERYKEVPSAALIAERLAPMVQFFSIGTNDLTQYTMAADRTNERVASLYQPTHPGVLSLIRRVVEAARNHGIWVGVCGEMASDVVMTPVLVGLGVDEMSMGSVSVPRVKKAIQSLSFAECEALALGILQMDSGEEVRRQLEKVAQQKYPELVT